MEDKIMQKSYISPNIKILMLDQEYLAKQDSKGEQNGQDILSNDALFDEDEDTTPKAPSLWDEE